MTKVGVVFTGGTFGGTPTGVVDVYDVWNEVALLELANSVGYEGEIVFRQPFVQLSENSSPEHWFLIRDEVVDLVGSEGVDGVVVVHGTDTLPFTACALEFLLAPPFSSGVVGVPVVVTGALLPALAVGSDAANNLGCALAACLGLPGGVYISFADGAFNTADVLIPCRTRKTLGGFVSVGVEHVASVDIFGGVSITPFWEERFLMGAGHPFDNYFGDYPSPEDIIMFTEWENAWKDEPVGDEVEVVSIRVAPGVNYEAFRIVVDNAMLRGRLPFVHIESFPSGSLPDRTNGVEEGSVVEFAAWCKNRGVPVVVTLPKPTVSPDELVMYSSSQRVLQYSTVVPTMLTEAAIVKGVLLRSFMRGSSDVRLFSVLFSTPLTHEFFTQ